MNNNNNRKNNVIVNRVDVEKYPRPTPKEVGGFDEIYAAPHFDSSDGKYSFDYTHSLLRFVLSRYVCFMIITSILLVENF